MKKSTLSIAVITLIIPMGSQAKPSFYKQFAATYPNISQGLKDNKCAICHVSNNDYARNPYGAALEGTLSTNGNKPNFAVVEALDSDGDGYTNIEEITAGTFPGDFNSHPDQH